MSARYLLPCPKCHTQLAVEAGRAGGVITCQCGQAVDIPTMRELRKLPQQDVSAEEAISRGEQPASTWTRRQGWIFLGSVLLLAGALPATYKWVTYPKPLAPTAEELQEFTDATIDGMSLTETWRLWKDYIEDQSLSRQPTQLEAVYEEQVAQTRQWFIVFGSLAGIGAIVLAVGLLQRS